MVSSRVVFAYIQILRIIIIIIRVYARYARVAFEWNSFKASSYILHVRLT